MLQQVQPCLLPRHLQSASHCNILAMSSVEALDRALSAVGDRWTLLVVAALLDGPLRFGDLQEAVPAIATNVLTQRLRALQEEGLVSAEPYPPRPARYSYELSASGPSWPARCACLPIGRGATRP